MFSLETEVQEFKKTLSELDKGLESLCAMLNKHCKGDVYFGVNDNGEIVGLSGQIGKETLRKISIRISELIKPVINPVIAIEQYEEKTIIHITATGNQRPYSCGGNYRIRIGSEDKQVDPDLLGEIFYSSQRISLESVECLNQDLSFNQLKSRFIARDLSINHENFDRNMNFLVNDRYNMLAELLSDSNNTSIKVVRFAGIDKQNMISRNEFGYQCLILAMEQASNFVKSLNETRVDITTSLQRNEISLFDMHSFEEAWTNACLHNKWIRNVPPAIYIFDNRIEIISMGGLPFDYSKEDFYHGVSNPVNIGLLKIMGQLGLVEQTGHGNLVIISKYGREAFDIRENSITVTIPFAFTPSMAKQVDNHDISLEKKLLNVIKQYPFFSREQLAKACNIGTTKIGDIINSLKQDGIIERIGGKKGGYWKVK